MLWFVCCSDVFLFMYMCVRLLLLCVSCSSFVCVSMFGVFFCCCVLLVCVCVCVCFVCCVFVVL